MKPSGPSISIFLAIVTSLTLSLATYLYFWGIRSLNLKLKAHLALSALLFLMVALLFVGPTLYRSGHYPVRDFWPQGFQWVHYTVMGWLGMLIMLSWIFHFFAGFKVGVGKLFFLRREVLPERRLFLTRGSRLAVVGTSFLATGVGLKTALSGPRLIEVHVTIPNLHPDLDGFKIAQISDLHIGPTIDRAYCQRVVDQVKALSPNLVALTGDLMDGNVSQLSNDMDPILELKHLGQGAYFCTGNHEYISGAAQWIEYFSKNGIHVLANQNRVLKVGEARFLVAGIHDPSALRWDPTHISDPKVALQNPEVQLDVDFKMLLAHQPKSIFQAAEAGFDLQLSGHTHAGQFFPFNLIARWVFPYFEGLHLHQKTWIYVNRGTGYWGPPNRFGNFSELTLLTLKRV